MAQVDYAECERRVLLSEGGYTNDPRDPGGPTNWGITLRDARAYWKPDATADDVRNMPRSVAVSIYKPEYWDKMGCDAIPAGPDYAKFDYGVNSGINRANRVYEQFSHLPPQECVDAICAERIAFLHSLPTWSHFGPGWGARVASVKAYSDHLAAAAEGIPPPHPENGPPSAKGYESGSKDTQPATNETQGSPLVRSQDPPATHIAPQPKAHWWAPVAAVGFGGSGSLEWLRQANDWAEELSMAKMNLEGLDAADVLHWLVTHPIVLLPAVLIGAGAWLWEDHKKTKRLLEELKKCSPQS